MNTEVAAEPTVRQSSFGRYIDLRMGDGDAIIVSLWGGALGQRTPVRLMLPHQLDLSTARNLMNEYGATEIEVIRIRSEDWIDVTALVRGER